MIVLPLFGCAALILLIAVFFFTPLWPLLLGLFLLYWIFGPKPVVIRQKFPSRQPESEPQRADDVIDVTAVDVTEPEKQPLLKEDDHAR